MSRVLVLGGAGFIGYHLARHLADEGASAITLVDDLSRGRLDEDLSALLGRPGVELVRADLTDPGAWARLAGPWDQTYMLVAVARIPARTDFRLQRPACDTRLTLENVGLSLTILLAVAVTVGSFIVAQPLLDIARHSVSFLGFPH